jgi:hypothetical protein
MTTFSVKSKIYANCNLEMIAILKSLIDPLPPNILVSSLEHKFKRKM